MTYSDNLLREYRTIQMGGLTNMLDIWRVHDIAEEFDLNELACFIEDFGSEGYMIMITTVQWNNINPYSDIVDEMR